MDIARDERKPDTMSVLTDLFAVPRTRTGSATAEAAAPSSSSATTANPVSTQVTGHVPARTTIGRRVRGWPRHLGLMLTVAGIAMVPWLVVLAVTLPARTAVGNWSFVWVGMDSLEAVALTATGLLLRRGDPRASLTAAAAAVLLLVDAWFDVLTAAPGSDRLVAVAMAAAAEVPLSGLCAVLSVRLFPRPERF
jgi:hypothetical protein